MLTMAKTHLVVDLPLDVHCIILVSPVIHFCTDVLR